MTVVQDYVVWDYSTSANASAHNDSGGRGPTVIAPRLVGTERSVVNVALSLTPVETRACPFPHSAAKRRLAVLFQCEALKKESGTA